MKQKTNLGIIGVGGFGQFLIKSYKEMPEIKIEAISDTNPKLLKTTAQQNKIKNYYLDYKELIKNPNLDVVVIATPPFLHFEMAQEAILAGKHVLCEKPLVLSRKEALDLIELAKIKKVKISVDLQMRYNPIYLAVSRIIKLNLFGHVSRIFFENYATDELLPPNHWFWDKSKSGGILIEHGVHFFDIFNFLLGEPKVLWATSNKRIKTDQEDRFFCILEYPGEVITSFYHAFDRPSYDLEKTETKLIFKRGVLTISGWIPLKLKGEALVSDKELNLLKKILKNSQFSYRKEYFHKKIFKSRNQEFEASKLVSFSLNLGRKELVYKKCVQKLVRDFVLSIYDKNHKPKVSVEDGLVSLEVALKATKLIKEKEKK